MQSYGISWIAAIAALLALLLWMIRDPRLVMYIAVGASVTFVALGAAGWLLVRGLQGFRGAAGIAWRYGLASLARRGRESVVQVVAFGLGLMVLLLLTLVRNDLMSTWRDSLPLDASYHVPHAATRRTDVAKDPKGQWVFRLVGREE